MKNITLLVFVLLLAFIANAQIVNIPDAYFKTALLEHNPVIDTNGDGEIQVSEASIYLGKINVPTSFISDLTGIEAFTNITKLDCRGNLLTNIDVSMNTALTELNCAQNQLTSVDLNDNTALEVFECWLNQITSLDVSNNTALIELDFGLNQLTSIDLSNNPALKKLVCKINQLTSLDLNNNPALTLIECNQNYLNSLDLSSHKHIVALLCASNQITTLDLSDSDSLYTIFCYNNQLTSLNVKNGNNTYIMNFDAMYNPNLLCIEVDDVEWSSYTWIDIDVQTSFSTDCSDGISDINTLIELTISPNPFTEQIGIDFDEYLTYEIILFDLLGKKLLSTTIKGLKYTLSTSELRNGIYFLQVKSEDGIRIEKIVKQ